jgi:hypothetical protein
MEYKIMYITPCLHASAVRSTVREAARPCLRQGLSSLCETRAVKRTVLAEDKARTRFVSPVRLRTSNSPTNIQMNIKMEVTYHNNQQDLL